MSDKGVCRTAQATPGLLKTRWGSLAKIFHKFQQFKFKKRVFEGDMIIY